MALVSSYKFFGSHSGILYGKHEHLENLTAYKVRPAPNDPPGKWMTGTQNHEGIAGILGALEYLAWVGETFGGHYAEKYQDRFSGFGLKLRQAMAAIRAYEFELSRALLEVLEETPGVTVYGPRDVRKLEGRVPTFSFTMNGMHSRRVAEKLDEAGIYVWDGKTYALVVTEQWGEVLAGLADLGVGLDDPRNEWVKRLFKD